jgi:hypothetical protein
MAGISGTWSTKSTCTILLPRQFKSRVAVQRADRISGLVALAWGSSFVDLAGRCVNHLPLLLELQNQSAA